MHKPATNISLRDGVERFFHGAKQRFDRAGLGAAQTGFDLRPALLNRVEVGRIGRQSEEPCAARRQQLFHARYTLYNCTQGSM